MRQKLLLPLLAAAFLFVLVATAAVSGLGQSAGQLSFGNISRSGKMTLSYGVINSENSAVAVGVSLTGEIEKIATVEPKRAVIQPKSYVPIYVTVNMPRNVEAGRNFAGHVLVRQSSDSGIAGGGSGIAFDVAVAKSVSATAAEDIASPQKPEPQKQKEPPYLLFALLLITAIVVGAMDPFEWRKKKK